jgi:hypothetical protein
MKARKKINKDCMRYLLQTKDKHMPRTDSRRMGQPLSSHQRLRKRRQGRETIEIGTLNGAQDAMQSTAATTPSAADADRLRHEEVARHACPLTRYCTHLGRRQGTGTSDEVGNKHPSNSLADTRSNGRRELSTGRQLR